MGKSRRILDGFSREARLASLYQPTLDMLAATVAASVGAMPHLGSGDKNRVDQAAVDAMRASLRGAEFGGIVVIGEGEKDSAPMLYNGELIGAGQPLEWDIAVDPIDGTALAARNEPGAVSVMAAADHGSMLQTTEVFYMKKIVTGAAGFGVVDVDLSATQNIHALAAELDMSPTDLRVAVIDKPRNADLIAEIESTGATWVRFAEGDVAMAVAAALPNSGVDMLLGVGGAPEGVVTACAVRCLGGFMQARFAPQTPDEIERAMMADYDLEKKLELLDLVAGERLSFVLSGVTEGMFTPGIVKDDESNELIVQSLVLDHMSSAPSFVEVRVERL
jgi:fructose-1,6-bisphosphatase II